MTINLEKLRKDIETADLQIMDSIRKRMETSFEIGNYKSENNMAVKNPSVESNVLERYHNFAKNNNLDIIFIEKLCKLIIEESVRLQNKIINEK